MREGVYLGLPRKWRPNRFAEVVGQTHITRTLLNAIRQGKVAHAFLLSGPRGIGKTTTARLLARALNCLQPEEGEPCNRCANCLQSLEGAFIDTIEIDAASNTGVDDIRLIRENVNFAPISGKVKVYIIDEVHMLSTSAFNALLKTLEEPPSHVYFCLATTAPQKVPPTILSRCLRLDFRRISSKELREHLAKILEAEHIDFEVEAIDLIARKADGSVRDALSLLDQVIAFGEGKVSRQETVEVMGEIRTDLYLDAIRLSFTKDLKKAFKLDSQLASLGIDPRDFLDGLQETILQILQVQALGIEETDLPLDSREQYRHIAETVNQADLIRMLNLASQAEIEVRREFNPRQKLQLLFLKFATLDRTIEIKALLEGLTQSNQRTITVEKPKAPETPSALSSHLSEGVKPAPRILSTQPSPPTIFSSPQVEEIKTHSPGEATKPSEGSPNLPPNSETTLEAAQAAWREVCEELISEHNSSGNLLKNETVVSSFRHGVLELLCSSQAVVNRAKSLQSDIIKGLTARLGPLQITFKIGKIQPPSMFPQEILEDPKIRLLVEELGARLKKTPKTSSF